jgi:hypothetical protein
MNISAYIKNNILKFLNRKGYKLLKIEEFEDRINYYKKVIEEDKKKETFDKIDCIVFSKDRAMQLHAFLSSYLEMVSNRSKMYILYKVSNEEHRRSYEELLSLFDQDDFVFVEETIFRDQLINLINISKAKTIGLFVDDMLFVQPVDFEHILHFDTLNHVVSLGRGKDLDYSVVLERNQKVPVLKNTKFNFKEFNWNFTEEKSDWTYPLGVSGYFFGNAELNVMLKEIKFKAPNSLENNLQYFKPFFIGRKGICKEDFICVGIHANMVQTEGPNPVIGTFSIDQLLKFWINGKMIDLNEFYGNTGAITQFKKYSFINRNRLES